MINILQSNVLKHKPSIGLALSGGGARGIAHIGVLRVLEREGIPVDYLAGTSMGGVMAAGYAAGMSSKDLEQTAFVASQKRHMVQLLDPGLGRGGVLRGQRLINFFKHEFGDKSFDDLPKQLAVVAVDLLTHQEVVIKEGAIALALRATTSIPGVFMPLEIDGRQLVDGGLLNNLPIDVVKNMGADVVIAVDIGFTYSEGVGQWIGNRSWVPDKISNMLEVFDNCLYTMRIVEQENKMRHFPPNVLICPDLPTNVNSFNGYDRAEELIEAGEKSAEEHLPEIKALLKLNSYWTEKDNFFAPSSIPEGSGNSH